MSKNIGQDYYSTSIVKRYLQSSCFSAVSDVEAVAALVVPAEDQDGIRWLQQGPNILDASGFSHSAFRAQTGPCAVSFGDSNPLSASQSPGCSTLSSGPSLKNKENKKGNKAFPAL